MHIFFKVMVHQILKELLHILMIFRLDFVSGLILLQFSLDWVETWWTVRL